MDGLRDEGWTGPDAGARTAGVRALAKREGSDRDASPPPLIAPLVAIADSESEVANVVQQQRPTTMSD
jgi:hypothetical protein